MLPSPNWYFTPGGRSATKWDEPGTGSGKPPLVDVTHNDKLDEKLFFDKAMGVIAFDLYGAFESDLFITNVDTNEKITVKSSSGGHGYKYYIRTLLSGTKIHISVNIDGKEYFYDGNKRVNPDAKKAKTITVTQWSGERITLESIKGVIPFEQMDDRLSGKNRFETAVKISQEYEANVSVAYIANGMDFPDALAGAALSGNTGGPVLLVQTNNIPDVVKNELTRLKPRSIVVLGGSGVVSDSVSKQLKQLER